MTDLQSVVDRAIGNSQDNGMNDPDKLRWNNTIGLLEHKDLKATANLMKEAAQDGEISPEEADKIKDMLPKDIRGREMDAFRYAMNEGLEFFDVDGLAVGAEEELSQENPDFNAISNELTVFKPTDKDRP